MEISEVFVKPFITFAEVAIFDSTWCNGMFPTWTVVSVLLSGNCTFGPKEIFFRSDRI